MTKVCIVIEDADDKTACAIAARRLFAAFIDHHGAEEASRLCHDSELHDPRWWANQEAQSKLQEARSKFNETLASLTWVDARLVLAYFAMPKPSKRKLSFELAQKNEDGEHYGPRGKTDPDTMLQQIKRVFCAHRDACRVIGLAAPGLREETI